MSSNRVALTTGISDITLATRQPLKLVPALPNQVSMFVEMGDGEGGGIRRKTELERTHAAQRTN